MTVRPGFELLRIFMSSEPFVFVLNELGDVFAMLVPFFRRA